MTHQSTLLRPARPAAHHVYLIYCADTGHTKIGRSANAGRRLREVADFRWATIIHLIASDDPAGVEAALHRRFADRRIKGEWFALTQAELDMLLMVTEADAASDLPAFLLPKDLLEDTYPKLVARRAHAAWAGQGKEPS